MSDSTTPPSSEPIVWHLDDIDWTEVQRQRNADGTVSVVREKWPIIRNGFLSAHVHYEPQMVVRRHGHRSNHVVVVLDGGAHIGIGPDAPWCTAGTHLHVPLGATFGPIIAGPDGVTCWEVSFGEFGGWGDEPEIVEAELRDRGIEPLPDPPLEIGDWFVDPRGDWGGERPSPRVPGLVEVIERFDDLPTDTVAPGVQLTRAIATPDFASSRISLDPGATFDTTHHGIRDTDRRGTRLLWIDAGSANLDGGRTTTLHGAGTHIEVAPGASLPTITAGPDGAIILELVNVEPEPIP